MHLGELRQKRQPCSAFAATHCQILGTCTDHSVVCLGTAGCLPRCRAKGDCGDKSSSARMGWSCLADQRWLEEVPAHATLKPYPRQSLLEHEEQVRLYSMANSDSQN